MREQPNLLVIFPDQLRRQALGCYGDPNVSTPHIDGLATRGVRCTAACSSYPVCVPFRFSLMTGLHAHQRDVPALGFRMDPAEHTLADAFNAADYETTWIGKWHLADVGPERPVPRELQGRWRHWRGFELRNHHFDTVYSIDDEAELRHVPGYQTDVLTDLAIESLEARARDRRPFCCVVSIEPPHFPYEAPEADLARWRGRELDLPPTFQVADDYEVPLSDWPDDRRDTDASRRDQVRTYYAMIENLDANVGRLLRTLDATGLREDTVVILLSDHGEMGGMHRLPTAMKEYPFEESIGIPLIVDDPRYPGRAGATISEPIATEDLFPTLCGLAGIDPGPALPGADCAPLLHGECHRLARPGVLLEHVRETRAPGAFRDRPYRGLRRRHDKYTTLAGQAWQYFDLRADPYEQRNLVADPAHRAAVAECHAQLRELLRATGDDRYPLSPEP